jgi:phage FluMu gp28-like protein
MRSKKQPTISPEVTSDPVTFAQAFLKNPDGTAANPHDGQIELLRGLISVFLAVACCGRQWGKSVSMGWYVCWYVVTHRNRQVYIIAPTLDQARIIFNEVAYQFRNTELAALVVGKIKEYPFPCIKLANGSEIHARGANSPEYIRGKPIHLAILDEAAFFKDGVISKVIEPMFTVTGKMEHAGLIMISTPFGQGDFYDYAQRAKADETARFFHYTSLDNPHANHSYLERIKKQYGEDSLLWQTEYLANFVDDDLAVIPWSYIKRAIERYPYDSFPRPPIEGHKYVQGVDLANVRDYFVASILDITDPSFVPLVHYDRLQKKGYAHYKKVVRANHQVYHPKTLIDATSLGESVVEDLADIHAEGYKFSQQSKYEIVQELVRMFAENRIAIPNDRAIIDELRYFTYEITANKTLKMEARHGHDDIVMSLALAAHLALIPITLGFFGSVNGFDPLEQAKAAQPPPDVDPFAELFKDEEDAYITQ